MWVWLKKEGVGSSKGCVGAGQVKDVGYIQELTDTTAEILTKDILLEVCALNKRQTRKKM